MTGFANLLEDQKLAVIHGVGYPNPNRSHFDSMDLWHTAHRRGGQTPTGWLGRFFDQQNSKENDLIGVHFGREEQPLALAGERVHVPTLQSLDDFRLRLDGKKQLKKLMQQNVLAKRERGNDLLTFVQSNTVSAIQTSSRIEQILGKYKSKSKYPQSGLGQKLSTVAQLIGSGLKTNVYYVTLDGFDTHANQREAHAGLLGQLSGAVKAFMDDLKEQGNDERTLTFVFSEFGRRVRENASHGTDHGAAAPAFLVGGKVKAGAHGKYPSLTDLLEDDLKHNVDYRSLYATLLEKWFKVDSKSILGKKHETMELLS